MGRINSIRVRLNGGLASPALFEFLDVEPKVEYVVAMASNAVLTRLSEETMIVARLCPGLTDDTEHVYVPATRWGSLSGLKNIQSAANENK
jgi:hypothetical protein